MEILGRDVAIAEYNLLCDMIDLAEDKRIEPTLKESDFEGKNLTKDEIAIEIEKSDEVREAIISAIQNGTLEVTETNVYQKLKTPIKDKEGKILMDKLVWEVDYQAYQLAQNTKGLDLEKDLLTVGLALIATRTNQSRVLIGKLFTKDFKLAKNINALFQSAS
jgi:hypothetical protein